MRILGNKINICGMHQYCNLVKMTQTNFGGVPNSFAQMKGITKNYELNFCLRKKVIMMIYYTSFLVY